MARRIVITKFARDGEYYAEGLWANSIGKRFPLNGDAIPEWSKATLIDAKVHSSQTAVDLTLEIDD